MTFLATSAAKIFTLSLGCHPLDDVTRGGPRPPLSPLVTPLKLANDESMVMRDGHVDGIVDKLLPLPRQYVIQTP